MTKRKTFDCGNCFEKFPLGDLKVEQTGKEYPLWLLCPGCGIKVMTQADLKETGWDPYEDACADDPELWLEDEQEDDLLDIL